MGQMSTYRQALGDLPAAKKADDVVWPEKPETLSR